MARRLLYRAGSLKTLPIVRTHCVADLRNHIDLTLPDFVSDTPKGTPKMATATKSKAKLRLQPMGERIVIQRVDSEETTAGGIVLPDSAREKPARGTVKAIGSGKLLDDGSRAASQLKEGDTVLFSSYAGETVEIDDVEYLLMREDDVLAVIE